MAKSKAKSKIHDEDLPEEIETVEDAGADEIELADADAVEAADVDAVEAADEDIADVEVGDIDGADVEVDDVKAKSAGDDGDDDEPKASVDEGPKPPKPKLTKLTIALMLLNLLAVPVFAFMAWQDYNARMQFAVRTMLNYTQVWGLPLREEEEYASLSNETRPRTRLSKEQLQAAFKSRPGVNSSAKDFTAVDEPVPFRLLPSDMTESFMELVFRGLPDPVPTLEDEIERLKDDKRGLPKIIADAADEVLKKLPDENAKRDTVRKTLYPIIADARWRGPATKETPINTWEIDKVNDRLLKATGPDLDALVKDSLQRRISWDILAPLNLFRPGDVSKTQIEKMGDLSVPLDEIKGYLIDRLNASIAEAYDPKVHVGPAFAKGIKRDTAEKRRKIAFILFTLGQVEKPGLNEKLIKKGVERAQTISGIYEFTNATIDFVGTVRTLEKRLADAIRDDREGATYKTDKGTITRNEGFIDQYEAEIDRLVRLVSNLETAQKRLVDLKERQTKVEATYNQRAKQFDDTMKKLLKEREITAKYMNDLRALQLQLHEALVELSDAAATNLRILAEITAIESDYIRKNSPKGGKK